MSAEADYFVHAQGICETDSVGTGTSIWAFAHVLPGAQIGSEVNLCDHTFIENDVVIGNRVTIKSFVAIWDGVRIEDDVFIGPGVMFSNDKYPRSKRHLDAYPVTTIRQGASIGAGAIILPGIEIGAYAMVAAGALVSRNVGPFEFIKGSPGRPCGYVCRCGAPLEKVDNVWRCTWGNWFGNEPSVDMRCNKCSTNA